MAKLRGVRYTEQEIWNSVFNGTHIRTIAAPGGSAPGGARGGLGNTYQSAEVLNKVFDATTRQLNTV